MPSKINVYQHGQKIKKYCLSTVHDVTSMLNDVHIYRGMLNGMLEDDVECLQSGYNDEVCIKGIKTSDDSKKTLFLNSNGSATNCSSIASAWAPITYQSMCTRGSCSLQRLHRPQSARLEWFAWLFHQREYRTFARCIMGKQFGRLKFGDRYYFTFIEGLDPFTAGKFTLNWFHWEKCCFLQLNWRPLERCLWPNSYVRSQIWSVSLEMRSSWKTRIIRWSNAMHHEAWIYRRGSDMLHDIQPGTSSLLHVWGEFSSIYYLHDVYDVYEIKIERKLNICVNKICVLWCSQHTLNWNNVLKLSVTR